MPGDWKGVQTWGKPPPLPIERQFTTPTDGSVRSMGWLTASVSDTKMALVEDGTLLGPRRFDMGNSGSAWLEPEAAECCFL